MVEGAYSSRQPHQQRQHSNCRAIGARATAGERPGQCWLHLVTLEAAPANRRWTGSRQQEAGGQQPQPLAQTPSERTTSFTAAPHRHTQCHRKHTSSSVTHRSRTQAAGPLERNCFRVGNCICGTKPSAGESVGRLPAKAKPRASANSRKKLTITGTVCGGPVLRRSLPLRDCSRAVRVDCI